MNLFKLLCILLFITGITSSSMAQQLFPEKCLGTWEGMMHIYAHGEIKDSVEVKFTVARTDSAHAFTWKTEYLSEKFPMVKDYTLKVIDPQKRLYVTDEGDGIVLRDYGFGDKLYSIFETSDILLTATYELSADQLIFEVTSGKMEETVKGINNYAVTHLQRVVYSRVKD